MATNLYGHPPGKGRFGLGIGFLTHTVEEQVFLLSSIVGQPDYVQRVPTSPLLPLDLEVRSMRKTLIDRPFS